jgi:catechol 2,3-dioxygenase-like lactoylglutathione lyase family enzyme
VALPSPENTMIKGFHHAALSTPDLDRCVAFYRDLLGCEVAWEFGWPAGSPAADEITGLQDSAARAAMLKLGGSFLEVFEFTSPPTPPATELRPVNAHGITHIAIEVKDLQAEFARLKGAGVHFHCEPKAQESGFVVYGRDPDGNVLELIEYT